MDAVRTVPYAPEMVRCFRFQESAPGPAMHASTRHQDKFYRSTSIVLALLFQTAIYTLLISSLGQFDAYFAMMALI